MNEWTPITKIYFRDKQVVTHAVVIANEMVFTIYRCLTKTKEVHYGPIILQTFKNFNLSLVFVAMHYYSLDNIMQFEILRLIVFYPDRKIIRVLSLINIMTMLLVPNYLPWYKRHTVNCMALN